MKTTTPLFSVMRFLFPALLYSYSGIRAQPSPLSFTISFASTQSITCTQTFVTIYLTSSYSASPLTYSWTNGTVVYTGTLVQVTSPGVYSITAIANPSLFWTQTVAVPLNLSAPSATVTPLSQGISCPVSTAVVNAMASQANATHYFLSPAGGSFVVQGAGASYAPGMPGTYTHVVVDDVTHCSTQRNFTVSSSGGFPTFSLSSTQNFTMGCFTKSLTSISIDQPASQPPGNQLSFGFAYAPNFTVGPATSHIFNPLSAGDYTVVARDNATGCEAGVPVSVLNNSYVPIPTSTNQYEVLSCKNPKLFYLNIPTEPGNFSYTWSVPGFPAPISFNHPYDTLTVFADPNPAATGSMSPWIVVTNNDNLCYMGLGFFIEQDMLPPTVTVSSTYSGNITCQHPSVVLTCKGQSSSQSWNPGVVGAYLWEGPPTQATGTLSSGYLAKVPGIYTVHVMDYKSGCTNTGTIQISDKRVYPQVAAPVQAFELCNGLMSIQPVSTSTIPLVYAWSSGTNAILSNPTASQVSVNAPGVYTLNVTDPASTCSVSIQLTVTVCTGLGTFTAGVFQVSAYPNPAAGYLLVETTVPLRALLSTPEGKLILTETLESGKTRLSLEAYPAGMYLLSFINGERVVKTIKVLNQK